MSTKKKSAAPPDPLDVLVAGDPKDVIALILWKGRHRQPDLFAQITAADIKGFKDCCEYQKITPAVVIQRPEGRPAQEAIPAAHGRAAAPARPADPPKPFVMVTLCDGQTGNAIRPIENNQEDFDRQAQSAATRKARDQAPTMADNILRAVRTGEWSLSEMQDAANALLVLARAQQE